MTISRPIIALAAVALATACATAITPAQQTGAQALVTVASSLVPGGSQALAVGQLLCAGGGGLEAIIDAVTGQPFLVTGKAAQVVANVCAVIGGVPTAAPSTPTTVSAKVVVVPKG